MSKIPLTRPHESSLRPTRALEPAQSVDALSVFAKDLKDAVGRMLPTGGRKYTQAAILAIDFSVSDIKGVKNLREELLDVLGKTYNWAIERYTIDCTKDWRLAKMDLHVAVSNFTAKYASRVANNRSMICFYFSGHGFPYGKPRELYICGSMKTTPAGREPRRPFMSWSHVTKAIPDSNDDKLVLMDCCASGLANIDDDHIEVIGASAWESAASDSPQASFTRALIDSLKQCNGNSVSTTRLVSSLHTKASYRKGVAQVVHKTTNLPTGPGLIHRIESTPVPLQQITDVPKRSHVIITVKVAKDDKVPDVNQWAKWIQSDLPPYIGEIDIKAVWKTGSRLVFIVLPVEIWLILPDRGAYAFVDYDYQYDGVLGRKIHEERMAGLRETSFPGPSRPISLPIHQPRPLPRSDENMPPSGQAPGTRDRNLERDKDFL